MGAAPATRMLKDAALTALVAAGARHLHRRLPHRDIGKGLTFDYQFVDLGIAVVDDLLRPARPVAGGDRA